VHAVYSGFSGPATGKLREEAKAELERLTIEILRGREGPASSTHAAR